LKGAIAMFHVGDKIVYPMHGAGIIEGIESRMINGKEVLYYNIKIISGNIKLMLPVENHSQMQLRPIISKDDAKDILENFDKISDSEDTTWNKRYKANVDKLRKGDILNVATVLKELIKREHDCGLSTGDRKMLILTKNIFCSEINLAIGIDVDTIYKSLTSAIL
jgi:transcriptional regulator, carD family